LGYNPKSLFGGEELTGFVLILTTTVSMLGDAMAGEPTTNYYYLSCLPLDDEARKAVDNIFQNLPLGKVLTKREDLENLREVVVKTLGLWEAMTYIEAKQDITI